ncbi:hypothetical protein FRC08_014114 [Ceratobasidium sp. 394]|nr:hypothetical protein FRC08_014114 [Ceratobasidium sp. 394]
MNFIQRLEVVYEHTNNAVDGEDINKGFGGEYIYLVPRYTSNPKEAARGFSVVTSVQEDWCATDISTGDGRALYRYIQAHYRPEGDGRPITSVHLQEQLMGDGHTGDLNKGRGGRYLYLCWKYAPIDSDSALGANIRAKNLAGQ